VRTISIYTKLGLLFACFLWAVSFVATKVALGSLPPLTVVTARLLVSAVCFLGWFAWRGVRPKVASLGALWRLFWLSLIGTGLHYGTQTIGLQYTTASNGSIYAATCPVWISLIAWVVLGERLSGRKMAGIAVALVGVLTVMGAKTLLSFELVGHLLGDSLVLVSIVLWGLFTVYGKRESEDLGALQLLGAVTVLGSLWMIPVGWWEISSRGVTLAEVSGKAWGAVGFLGVTCSFLATLLYFVALEKGESQKVGVYLYTIPPMTTVVASVALLEPIGLNFVAGSLLVLTGVWLTERG
jgi:drug/metabolite transporter (DMT)-like permease